MTRSWSDFTVPHAAATAPSIHAGELLTAAHPM
jgi:hypothetical protein